MSPNEASPKVKGPNEDFAAFVDNMTAALEASTSAAAQFPDKSDISFHRSMDRKFGRELDSTCDRVLQLTDKLLQLSVDNQNARSKSQGKGRTIARRRLADEDDIVDHYHKTVVEPVDGLLEDADTNLDELNGQKKKAAIDIDAQIAARSSKKLPGPHLEEQAWRNDESVSKPQLLFRDKIDNSATAPPWRPTLHDKPHAMVPLGFVVGKDEDSPLFISTDPAKNKATRERQERALLHPYYYETRHLPYPTSMFKQTTPQKPKDFDDTPFQFVETAEQLHEVTKELLKAKEIAVDLEYHQVHSYYGFICLMQISTREKDWVIDTLKLRHELREHKLGGVLVDPSIVKVFHGADSDMIWLQQDFDIYVVNLFDTFHACKVLEFPKFSLASLLEAYCGFDADKKYQMADWRIRPIPEEMMRYARSDTHFLLYIYDELRNALLLRSSRTPTPEADEAEGIKPNPQRAIREVLNRSAETALKLYQREGYDHEKGLGQNGWANLAKKHFKKEKLESQDGAVFRALHAFRDKLARELDESPHHVLANYALVKLATLAPTDVYMFPKNFAIKNPLIKDHIEEICSIIAGVVRSYAKCQNCGKTGHYGRACSEAPASINAPSAPAPRSVASASRSEPKRMKIDPSSGPDVWKDLVNGNRNPANTQPRSALFGQTLPSRPAPAPAQMPTSMFGARNVRQSSPGFAAIQRTIHSDIAPVPTPAEPADLFKAALNPETVPFVPADQRKNTSDQTPKSTSTSTFKSAKPKIAESKEATPKSVKAAVERETDQVVQVKKKKGGKKDKGKVTEVPAGDAAAVSSGRTSPASAPASDRQTPTSDKAGKKDKKEKSAAKAKQDIPEFSYTNEPNLLDQPKSGIQAARRKPKPKKEKKTGIDMSGGFPRAPQNKTEPKSGSKSGTFTG